MLHALVQQVARLPRLFFASFAAFLLCLVAVFWQCYLTWWLPATPVDAVSGALYDPARKPGCICK